MLSLIIMLLLATPIYIMAHTGDESSPPDSAFKDLWIVRLSLNLLGYAIIFAPGYLILQWIRRTNYFDRAGMVEI